MNEKTGKKEDIIYTAWKNDIELWADENKGSLIESVEGVNSVFSKKSYYNVYLDKRYDANVVLTNILALLRGNSNGS